MSDQKAKIRSKIQKIQEACGRLTCHDPDGKELDQIGQSWYRYQRGGSYLRFENCVAKCHYCGFTTIAHRINNDRTEEIGPWKAGDSGGNYH